jgi:uncharacterized protein YerC
MASFEKLLPDLLTKKEKSVLQKRFKITALLKGRLTYREIAALLGISTTTVVRINKRLRIRKKGRKFKKNLSSKGEKEKVKIPWKLG